MATTVTISKALIGKEDIQFESADTTPSTFTRSASGASTQAITKLAAAHLKLEDANSRISATDVEGALQEIALNVNNAVVVFADGKGSDIASAASISLPSAHLYFDVTGTTAISDIVPDGGAVAGRLVVLQFDATITISFSATLKLDSDFMAVAGAHLMLIYDGAAWRELSRSGGTTIVLGVGGGAVTQGVLLHGGPMVSRNNEELGDVYSTSDADIVYSAGEPLNGFIGGQNDRAF